MFDHALRIRVKAETSSGPENTVVESAASSSPDDNTKGLDSSENRSGDEEDTDTMHSQHTITASTATAATSSTTTAVAPVAAPKASDSPGDKAKESEKVDKRKNILGKINNLVTSDLDNITGARDFLSLCECGVFAPDIRNLNYSKSSLLL